jgi:Ca2+-transporting ATPase
VLLSLLQGGAVSVAVVGLYAGLLSQGVQAGLASTVAFVLLVAANAVLILPSRSGRVHWRNLFQGLTPVSLWVLGGTLLALCAITTVPGLAAPFHFVTLSPGQWLATLAAGFSLLLVFVGGQRLLRP